ncbi:hypothetical protein RND71_027737 [Anisodus tanguticus]|uniref:Uncharacterized protein n=1 Tax=Anisodus tanguticus TaxID=243964 RepID=A0AAE1RJD6_9SOLA|nr:hypothetical protein RND71_027737 [Anisodus tanguticus]
MSKQLGQFLQEQQEPFTLELYLLERGRSIRGKGTLFSDGDFRCCSRNSSTKFLKRSANCGAKKRRKVIPNCSKIVKSVFNKLVTIIHNQKIKNLGSVEQNNATSKNINCQGNTNADDDKFSSASSSTVFNSCLDTSDAEEADNLSSPQAADDNFLHEEQAKKQEEFSTPSVLNSGETSPESQYIKNKKAIQQSRQLLLDCVTEVVENQKKKEEFQRILGAEQLWELLLQNIWLWSQDSINETNINGLTHFDLLNSFEESSGVEEKREIGRVVGDSIFVDVSNEIGSFLGVF